MGGLNFKQIKKWKFHRIKTWQILLALVPLLFIDLTLLRFDHLKMVELRDAVLAADVDGDETILSQKLEELKNFTFSHIVVYIDESNGSQYLNFGTGVFYLEQQYIRAASEALSEAQAIIASSNTGSDRDVFQGAIDMCSSIGSYYAYIDCMYSEIDRHPGTGNLIDSVRANIPSTELYRKNYASPLWAPCPAGFFILITLLIIVFLICRFIFWIFLRIALRVMQ